MEQIDIMLARASVLKEVKRYKEAIAILNEVLILDSDHLEAMRLICICSLYVGNISEARITADRMLAVNAACDTAYFFHAEMNYETGNMEEAIEMINEAIRIKPDIPQYLVAKAKYYTTVGDPEMGLQLAEEAQRLNPEYAFAYTALAHAQTAMVFGKPKMGKSYLCVEFAGYLARNHGKVLYVANEGGLDYTLQEKLNDKNVKHPNLYVTGTLPTSLAAYDFIFLDSVNRLGLTPEDLRALKARYPEKSFIGIFQATKQGSFRGENSFQHDVDVVIEVPEKGKAVQMGRFNQGGELDIFNS